MALVSLKLGITGFGGPAAHIAMMKEEFVERRRWLDRATFLDLLGATNLIPGPNSTEMAIHIGYLRAGWIGLVLAGIGFILPAMLLVMALAMTYARYGTLPAAGWLLYGIKPVIVAIIVQALWSLRKSALKGPVIGVAGVAVLVLGVLGVNQIALLVLAGLAVMLVANRTRSGGPARHAAGAGLGLWPGLASGGTALTAATGAVMAVPATLTNLFLTFLKIGSVLYGSGYVLLAFLQADFVDRFQWLTSNQLLDAVAIGQFTPGPVLTTATFIGYLVAGAPGAVLATVAIFLPAFVFVAICNPVIPRLRKSPWAGAFLDGVNVASLALMALVTWKLAVTAVVDWLSLALLAAALVAVFRLKLNSAWWVLAGAATGFCARFAGLV